MTKQLKEFLYVGHYTDKDGNFILKVGTTNNLDRRRKEHNRNYKKSPSYTMPSGGEFVYDFSLPLSKYNTLRYEDKTRQRWQNEGVGEFIRNDRFYCKKKAQNRQSDDTQNLRNPARLSGIFCAFFTKTFSPKIKRDFCINCLLTIKRKCSIMAGRAGMCGSEIPIGPTYAKFLFNPADFHMAPYFPEN